MAAGEVILKAIEALCPLTDHINDHFAFEEMKASLNYIFKKHCEEQSSLEPNSPRNQLHFFTKGK